MDTTPDERQPKRATRSRGRSEIGRYGVVPESVYERLCGNTTAIALYGLLAVHANGDGTAWPHQETLAVKLGVSEPTIRREIKTLVAAGLLEICARLNEKGRKIGNEYVVILPTGTITHDRSGYDPDRSPMIGDELRPERSPMIGTTDHPRAPRGRERLLVNSPNEQSSGSDEPKPLEHRIAERVFERKTPRPAGRHAFPSTRQIARSLLDAGWPPQQIENAMVAASTISIGACEIELNRKPRSHANGEDKQAMIDRRFGFTREAQP